MREDLVIDTQFHIVKIAGEEVHLYPKEYEVLYFLSQYPGWVFSSKQIYRAVWNERRGHMIRWSAMQSLRFGKN